MPNTDKLMQFQILKARVQSIECRKRLNGSKVGVVDHDPKCKHAKVHVRSSFFQVEKNKKRKEKKKKEKN